MQNLSRHYKEAHGEKNSSEYCDYCGKRVLRMTRHIEGDKARVGCRERHNGKTLEFREMEDQPVDGRTKCQVCRKVLAPSTMKRHKKKCKPINFKSIDKNISNTQTG